MQLGLELITQNQIEAIFCVYYRRQRVELFHWNSGQLAQTGMIMNNQVIAAALGLMNICMFLISKWSLLLCYTFPLSQSFFPAKYSTVHIKNKNNELKYINILTQQDPIGKLVVLNNKDTTHFSPSGLCKLWSTWTKIHVEVDH